MLHVIAAGDDDVVVPVVGFEGGFDFFGFGYMPCGLLFAVGGPDCLFAGHGHDATAPGAACFVVENAGKAIRAVEISLIAGDDEVIALDAAVLNAGIAARGDFV